jgi:transcriptional regulator with XRE-family HTH domain
MPDRIYAKNPPRLFIAEWREKRGLTQEQVGARLGPPPGVSDVTVSRWETGKRRAGLDVLAALAEALDCHSTDFFRHPDQPSADALLRDQPAEVQEQAIKLITAIRR